MEKKSKIYVAGHQGMVGSAIVRKLKAEGYLNIVGKTRQELDLTCQEAVADFMKSEKPEYVFLAAGKVGGIIANNVYRAQFIYENLMIQNNLIHHSYLNGVKKLIFLGSSCIYPGNCPQPIKEEYLLSSGLEQTNEPYAVAKIAGIKMCENYYRQYGCKFFSVMPTNQYGPNDNYNLETSHVLPALIRKLHIGKCLETGDWASLQKDLDYYPIEGITGSSEKKIILGVLNKYGISVTSKSPSGSSDIDIFNNPVEIKLWGSGEVYREFMHVDDLASVCVGLMENIVVSDLIRNDTTGKQKISFINIGTGEDQTICQLVKIIREITGYQGTVSWDSTKPDGVRIKLLDISSLTKFGFSDFIPLKEGIQETYRYYLLYR